MITILLMALVVSGVVAAISLRRPGAPAVSRGPADPVQIELLSRFVARSQRFRRSGAITGILVAAAVAVVASAQTGPNDEPSVDLVTLASIGLAGSIIGSILGEAFRTRSAPGPRVASLTVRDPAAYADGAADRRELILLGLTAIGIVGAVITGTGLAATLLAGVAVCTLAVVRRWTVRRIALRHRPVLAAEVAEGDDQIRRLAASVGVSRPIITLDALLISAAWFVVASASDAHGPVRAAAAIGQVGAIAMFLSACWWWWGNRSFGLDSDRLRAVAPTSHLTMWALGGLGLLLISLLLLGAARS